MKKTAITSAIIIAAIAVFVLGYYYFNDEDLKPLRASRPDVPGPPPTPAPPPPPPAEDPLKRPGIQKVVDGYITTNAYTKQEKFHPFMDQQQADQIAAKITALESSPVEAAAAPVKSAESGSAVKGESAKELKNQLLNCFYRYKAGKAEKMGKKEIEQILIFEATFVGSYE